MGMLFCFLIGVAMAFVYVGAVNWFVNRLRRKEQRLNLSKDASWMANFFGTHREEEYDPLYPRQECQDMLDFLITVNHYAAIELSMIADDHLDSGSIPCIVHGDEHRYRAYLIGEVCHVIQKRQLA